MIASAPEREPLRCTSRQSDLPDRVFDKRQRVNQAAIVENKRLGPVLAYIAERRKELDMNRSRNAPQRRGQAASLFKVG